MELFWKYKNKIAILLIVITIIKLVLILFAKGLAVSDLIDSLIPIGGAIYVIILKPREKKS